MEDSANIEDEEKKSMNSKTRIKPRSILATTF